MLAAGRHNDYIYDTATLVDTLAVGASTAVIADAVDDNDRRPAAERSECRVGQMARPVASYSVFAEIAAVMAHVSPGIPSIVADIPAVIVPIARPICTTVAV